MVKNTVASQQDFKKGFAEFGMIFGNLFGLFGVVLFILNYRHAKR